ncbi:hypothetical protein [Ferrimicrobium sp.]|uniref:hypothetical protein n=1 Tax=Ferrimicrobium sp. TaxID=2926050 RepID=UPI00260C1A63|nr:hypothetical protein [Ferrimicrobium sp.]
MVSAREVIDLLSQPELLENFGEELPLIDHLVQTSEVLWHDSGDCELAVAGLLHDLGWWTGSNESQHASEGSRLVRELGFSERVGQLIGLHVTAKRYLVRTDPRYWGRLSKESRATLVEQGGQLALDEVKRFEASPFFDDAVRLRLADDMAKDPHRVRGDIEKFYPIIAEALERAH